MPEPLIIHGSQRPFNSGFDSDAAWLDDIQRQVGGKRGYQGKHGAAHWLKLTNAKHSRGVAQLIQRLRTPTNLCSLTPNPVSST